MFKLNGVYILIIPLIIKKENWFLKVNDLFLEG